MIKDKKKTFSENILYTRPLLALETGVAGGSVSLYSRGAEIDFWVGGGVVSRSEDVLDEISKMLSRNKVDKKDIGCVAYSSGPGSFTGLRVGAAVAGGLSKSLSCLSIGCPVLEALTIDETGDVLAAVPFGKEQICWRLFAGENAGRSGSAPKVETSVSEMRTFARDIERLTFQKIIFHQRLYEKFVDAGAFDSSGANNGEGRFINAGDNLAGLIAAKVFKYEASNESDDRRLIYQSRN